MTHAAISEIHFGLDRSTLLEGPDWGEIDEDASVAAYRAALQKRLQQAFPAAIVEIVDVPRIRSWAFRADGSDAGRATCASVWYDTATDIDEQLFNEPDAWLVARRPVTVTEQELELGSALEAELAEVGLGLGLKESTTATPTRAQRALAHRRLRVHFEQVIAEELLEQVAVEHDLECELVAISEGWAIIRPDSTDPLQLDPEPLAAGDTPLAAVLELQRDLDADANWAAPGPVER